MEPSGTELAWLAAEAWLKEWYLKHPDEDRNEIELLLSDDFQSEDM